MNSSSVLNTSIPNPFTNTILLPCAEGQIPGLHTIGPNQPRKKRAHTKSRRGCIACKLRRVKCDEHIPCSKCVKRNVQCQPSPSGLAPERTGANPHLELDLHPQISLLQLELFHHWDKETRSTLSFPQIWPVVMRRAFNDQSIMSSILCIAAMHLTYLNPESTKYARVSTQLLSRAVGLFRKSLSHPLTTDNCEALMGTALLINYISWFDLGFLDNSTQPKSNLNIGQDQLFFLGPCIVQLWFQAIPILIERGSIFTEIMFHHPRLHIEQSLRENGVEPSNFSESLLEILGGLPDRASKLGASETGNGGTFSAWRFLSSLEKEAPWQKEDFQYTETPESHDERTLLHVKDAAARICVDYSSASPTTPFVPSNSRSLFTTIIRSLSPLLCCASLTTASTTVEYSSIVHQSHIEELLFGFPILCCGPFTSLLIEEDSRALVILFWFYHVVGRLLPPGRCWWAHPRSCLMEELIGKELESRGLDSALYI